MQSVEFFSDFEVGAGLKYTLYVKGYSGDAGKLIVTFGLGRQLNRKIKKIIFRQLLKNS